MGGPSDTDDSGSPTQWERYMTAAAQKSVALHHAAEDPVQEDPDPPLARLSHHERRLLHKSWVAWQCETWFMRSRPPDSTACSWREASDQLRLPSLLWASQPISCPHGSRIGKDTGGCVSMTCNVSLAVWQQVKDGGIRPNPLPSSIYASCAPEEFGVQHDNPIGPPTVLVPSVILGHVYFTSWYTVVAPPHLDLHTMHPTRWYTAMPTDSLGRKRRWNAAELLSAFSHLPDDHTLCIRVRERIRLESSIDPIGLGWRVLMITALTHPLYSEHADPDLLLSLREQLNAIRQQATHDLLAQPHPPLEHIVTPTAESLREGHLLRPIVPFGALNLVALGTLLRGGVVGGYILDSTPPRSLGFPPRPLIVIPLHVCLQRYLSIHQTLASRTATPQWIAIWARPIAKPLSPRTAAFPRDSPLPLRPRDLRRRERYPDRSRSPESGK